MAVPIFPDRAETLFEQAAPFLKGLLQNAPQFGTAGLTFIIHEGEITRVDVATSVQRKLSKN